MKPIEHILEGILDDEYDVDIIDNNPLISIFKKSSLSKIDYCVHLDYRDGLELMKLPIKYDLSQYNFEHIDPPLKNYVKAV